MNLQSALSTQSSTLRKKEKERKKEKKEKEKEKNEIPKYRWIL